MASIEKRPRQDGRASWRAHYRTPSGEQRNKTFDRKADAERFLANVESSKNTGSFVDSVLARMRRRHAVHQNRVPAERLRLALTTEEDRGFLAVEGAQARIG